jgi:hypothetical protein
MCSLLPWYTEFPVYFINFDCWPAKKSGNWRKFHVSANKIPEPAENFIFSREIPALRALSPPETCLELIF